MALYDYSCRECGETQEERHSVNESPTITCNACGSANTFRKISAIRTLFKGSGFYSTENDLDKIGMPKLTQERAKETLKKL